MAPFHPNGKKVVAKEKAAQGNKEKLLKWTELEGLDDLNLEDSDKNVPSADAVTDAVDRPRGVTAERPQPAWSAC